MLAAAGEMERGRAERVGWGRQLAEPPNPNRALKSAHPPSQGLAISGAVRGSSRPGISAASPGWCADTRGEGNKHSTKGKGSEAIGGISPDKRPFINPKHTKDGNS